MLRRTLSAALLALAAFAAAGPASAQSDQPLRIIVGFAPGGSVDITARLLAERMRETLKRPVIVENKAGAGGRIAPETLKTAAPDGNTIMITTIGQMSVQPNIFSDLRYDPVNDFTPIGLVVTSDLGLFVGPATPAKSVPEFVAWAKANPDKANYATPGAGTLLHFLGLLFTKQAGIEMKHITYRGGAPALNDLVGGQVPAMFDSIVDVMEMHKAGRIKIIATSGAKRSPLTPDVPTFKESGFDIATGAWFGAYGPAKLPAEHVARIGAAIRDALKAPDVVARFQALGLIALGSSPEELVATQKADFDRWGPIIKASGFKPN